MNHEVSKNQYEYFPIFLLADVISFLLQII